MRVITVLISAASKGFDSRRLHHLPPHFHWGSTSSFRRLQHVSIKHPNRRFKGLRTQVHVAFPSINSTSSPQQTAMLTQRRCQPFRRIEVPPDADHYRV